MVDSIVTIAHNLGLSVVAEGVEHEEQVSQLKDLNCNTVQGYFLSKPMSHQQFEEYLVASCSTNEQAIHESKKFENINVVH